MNKNFHTILLSMCVVWLSSGEGEAQVSKQADYKNISSDIIGTFQGITFREAGFSGLYPIPNTNGKEFWTVSDRGVNVDAANANSASCRPTYDKIYGFQNYAPKIHRIKLNIGDSTIQILKTISLKRPDGTTATGLLNPTNFGSTAAEVPSTDTVQNCANFAIKTAAKDIWGIDSEGIVVDRDGNFWICEEGGPTIWKVAPSGVVLKRFTPYANLPGAESIDVQIDSVFKYRKNNRGFEGIALTPNGKIYAIIQSPILFPNKSVGEGTKIHRILEIDPATNASRMFAYLNEGIIGSGSNQIRLRDWKIGDMAAITDTTFLVIEAALRGTSDIKKIFKINIADASPVNSGLYGTKTLEGLVDEAGLASNGIVPVKKTLFLDLLANGWPAELDKAEGLAILNDSTIAIGNDNDYGQTTLNASENGVAIATGKLSHIFTYSLQGTDKITGFKSAEPIGVTGPSTSKSPYVVPAAPGVKLTSVLSVGDDVAGYKMVGIPDGLGAYDNGNGTFTLLMNHELGNTVGIARAHGSKGAFVSKWVINKSDLSVVSGSDLIQNVNLWNGTNYITYNSANPSPLTAFTRFCSADLPAPSAFYNSVTGNGTQERIFMNGEEGGAESRAMAHIVTGPNGGTSYELPRLGKGAWENSLASPATGDKTLVAMPNDGSITDSKVYFYVGTKTNTGTEVEKAGLTNGKLLTVQIAGYPSERTSGTVFNTPPAAGTRFSLIDLGNVENLTGAALNTSANTAGATKFARPEDGLWDPKNPNDFYFNTTDQLDQVNDGIGTQVGRSKVWRLRFDDINNPELGGTVEAVLDGTEGQVMLDNMTIDNFGHLLLQEDVGNAAHNGKIWEYTIATDQLKLIGQHDQARFGNVGVPAIAPYNQDEEASGVIDMSEILGAGMFLMVDQSHYAIPGELVEGGQLLAMFNPGSALHVPSVSNIIKSTNEDFAVSFAAADFNAAFTDADGDNLTAVKIVSSPVNGVLSINGNAVSAGQVIPASSLDSVKYTSIANFFGSDSITYNATDGISFAANNAKIKLSIQAVNDAPVVSEFTKTTQEDVSVTYTTADFDNAFFDQEGNKLEKLQIVALPLMGTLKVNGTNIKAGQTIHRAKFASITYVPQANKFGSTYFHWKGFDGVSLSASTAKSFITIEGQNDAPVISFLVKNTLKNTTVFFQRQNFEGAYLDDEFTALRKILIVTLPSSGVLKLNNINITSGQIIEASRLSEINFVPAGGMEGTTTFDWKASDGVQYSAAAKVYIQVGNQNRKEDGEIASVSEMLTLSPVPATDYVNVNFFSQGGTTEISLVDALSNEVLHENVNAVSGNNSVKISLESVSPGMYFVNLVFRWKQKRT